MGRETEPSQNLHLLYMNEMVGGEAAKCSLGGAAEGGRDSQARSRAVRGGRDSELPVGQSLDGRERSTPVPHEQSGRG